MIGSFQLGRQIEDIKHFEAGIEDLPRAVRNIFDFEEVAYARLECQLGRQGIALPGVWANQVGVSPLGATNDISSLRVE